MALALSTLPGCSIFEYPGECGGQVRVVYDWSGAAYDGFTMPEGMSIFLFPTGGGDYWRFETLSQGGLIGPSPGAYNLVAANNDTKSVILDGYSSASSLYAYSTAGSVLDQVDARFRGAEPPRQVDEPVRREPDAFFVADGRDSVPDLSNAPAATGLYTVEMSPRLFTPLYTVIVEEVDNVSSVSACSMSLSGMAAGKYLVDKKRIATPVTIPGALEVNGDSRFIGQMYNFGPVDQAQHQLAVYVWLNNGDKKVFNFDVTEQIEGREEEMFLTIRVRGINLPATSGGSTGSMDVGIDNWVTENIELSN